MLWSNLAHCSEASWLSCVPESLVGLLNCRIAIFQLEAKKKGEVKVTITSSGDSAGNRVCVSWSSMIQFPYPLLNAISLSGILNPRRKYIY